MSYQPVYPPLLDTLSSVRLQTWDDFTLVLGNIETGSLDTEVISRNVALRNELDLYVNVLTCKSYAGAIARQKDINICIVRQNTEGEYAMLEHEVQSLLWFSAY